jgi:hypothetical protein
MGQGEAQKVRAAVVACAVLVVLMLAPLFRHPAAICGASAHRSHDYLQQASYDRLMRKAVLEDHEFPLRTHFLGGGYPLPANPQDPAFSPFSLTPLIFGEALGMKINIVIFFLIGTLGIFFLARRVFDASTLGSAYAATAYALSGWWLSRLEWGFYFKLYFHLAPWIWFYLEKARSHAATADSQDGLPIIKNIVIAGLLTAITLTQLGLGYVVIALFFFVYFTVDSLATHRARRSRILSVSLIGLACAFALSLVFGAAKVWPMIELLLQSSRRVDNYDIYRGVAGGYPHFYESLGVFAKALVLPSSIPNESIWPGWLTLPLAAVGLAAGFRKMWPLFASALLFTVICFGPYFPIDLFKPLWLLPFFRSMHAPYQLFSYFVLATLCLGAARGFDVVRAPELRRVKIALGVIAFASLMLGYLLFNLNVLSGVFTKEAPRLAAQKSQGDFYSVKGIGMVRGAPRTNHSQQYFNIMRGVGTIDWDGDVLLAEYAQPRFFIDAQDRREIVSQYKGEAYFENTQGDIDSLKISSNRITITGTVSGSGLVVVNQNWDKHFRCNFPLIAHKGLLAAKLPPGQFEAHFVYRPWPTLAGMACSAISVAFALVFLYRKRKQRRNFPGDQQGL